MDVGLAVRDDDDVRPREFPGYDARQSRLVPFVLSRTAGAARRIRGITEAASRRSVPRRQRSAKPLEVSAGIEAPGRSALW